MTRFRRWLCRLLCGGAPDTRPIPMGNELAGIIEDLSRDIETIDPKSIYRPTKGKTR